MQASTKSPIMMSRGARFLDLVKQNKLNISPQLLNKRRPSLCEAFIRERDEADNKPKVTQEKDYLKFSSQSKFNPDASPVSSILSKRKAHSTNITASSPLSSSANSSAKRKRVGFRDPVSSTKEYLISKQEERQKSNSLIRCLRYDNDIEAEEDEDCCIDKENMIQVKEEANVEEEIQEEVLAKADAILDHDYEKNQGSPQNTDVTTSDDSTVVNESMLTFRNQSELMDYVTKNLSVDELLKKLTQAEEESLKRKELISKVIQSVGINGLISEYFKINDTSAKLSNEQNNLINSIITEVSKLMQSNLNVKHKVLDVLSENHSKALLDHVLQENSPNSVCDKIAMPNIVNYLIHKANVDETDEHEENLKRMNSELIRHLINNTLKGKEIASDKKEVCLLMELLFKNKKLSDIIDVSNDVLRKLVEKR